MAKLFWFDSELRFLEKQMQEPPGYRPRGCGICIGESAWKSHDDYMEIVDYVINRMQMEQLKVRVGEIFCGEEKEESVFRNAMHRENFRTLLTKQMGNAFWHSPNYAAAVFLLSADEKLWQLISGNIADTGIYFDRVKLGGVTLEEYILFHAARDAYSGTRHIRVSELADRELIPDDILRLIIHAFVIGKCGVEIVKRGGAE